MLWLLLVFTEMRPFGRRRIALALELMGLAPFVASSHGSLQELGVTLEDAIIAYEDHCRPALAAQMAQANHRVARTRPSTRGFAWWRSSRTPTSSS
jgi:hypothetical protein